MMLDDSRVRQLAVNPAAAAAFPFLALTVREPETGCCGGKPGPPVLRPDYHKIKLAIAALSPERQKKLLGFLGAEKARLIHREGRRKLDVVLG